MSVELAQRLREATVVLSEAQLEIYEEAVTKLAAVNAPAASDQLCRLRLAFSLPIALSDAGRFDEQLTQAGVTLAGQEDQLRRVLAACVLIQRFARGAGRRRRATLTPDSLAALGARILANAHARPVHPDVVSWGSYWVETAGRELRAGGGTADPPVLELPDVIEDETVTPQQALRQTLDGWRERLQVYTGELAQWSSSLDPANVAAQGEQLSLLWWLSSAADDIPATEAAVAAATSLAELTLTIPGPPGAEQLLRRRLSAYQDESVRLGDLMALADAHEQVPAGVQDICLLLGGSQTLWDRCLPVSAAAEWMLDELLFVRLFSELS
jgi:hypothetical protein